MDLLVRDIRLAIRSLISRPLFSALVAGTLALGIGANTALFSVVNAVLLNPLPYPDPDQIVTFHQSKPNFDMGAIPYPNFLDLQKENRTFSSMAISRSFGFSLLGAGEPERVNARLISADLFEALGVRPMLGRTFNAADDRNGAGPVALISAGLWERKFGSVANVTDKTITLDDKNYAIVGVIPASFDLFGKTEVYVPIGQWNSPALKVRGAGLGLHGIGRLKPGVTVTQAQADLERVMGDLANTYPDTNRGNSARVISLKEQVVGNIRSTLLTLLGAVAFVLLIACVNVSNLMLARSTARKREFAIRTALGAGRWRLLSQSLTESLILALAGGALGLVVAEWGVRAALAFLPSALPRAQEIRLDTRVLLFTLATSLFSGILAGVFPALKASESQLHDSLKEGGRSVSDTRTRAQAALVAVEMAMALVLLVGAGLMIRSFQRVWKVDPGFNPDHVISFGLTMAPEMRNASPKTIRTALRELNEKLGSVPGVQAVSFSTGATPLQSEDDVFFWLDSKSKPASQSEMNMALIYGVEPDYLQVMGIPLKQGRFFTKQDDERSLSVAVIDESFAHRYFGTADPIGQRIHIDGVDEPSQIVGVVGHVKQWGLDSENLQSLQAQLYLPFRAIPDPALPVNGFGVWVRSDGNTGSGETTIVNSLRAAVQSQSNQHVISGIRTMNEVIANSLGQRRFSMILLGAFATVALLLASLGIYGVISYLVGQRTHEFGIRMALGAERRDILRLVLGHGMKMTLAGMAIGIIAALGLMRLIAAMLFGVGPTDPITFAGIAVLLMLVALLACYVPARRATKVDPLVALRYE
jgi:predicted permease